jgi:hypothetical protein
MNAEKDIRQSGIAAFHSLVALALSIPERKIPLIARLAARSSTASIVRICERNTPFVLGGSVRYASAANDTIAARNIPCAHHWSTRATV